MKILALSDLHGDRTFAKKMAELGSKEKVDLVIIAGDLVDHTANIDGLIGPFKEKGLEIAVIPGNHEGLAEIGFLQEKYGVKNLHGYALKKGDIGIFGCGYGDIGVHQLTEEDFFSTLKRAHDSLPEVRKKLMVTHVQPKDSLLGLGIFTGSAGVRKALDELKPDLHLCGHIHETQGIEEKVGSTRVINVGKGGKIIEL